MSEEIKKIGKIKKISQEITQKVPALEPNRERFEAAMDQDIKQHSLETNKVERENKRSLMDEVRDASHQVQLVKRALPDKVVAQAEDAIESIEKIKNRLSDPDLQIKNSARRVLRSKLQHIDESLKVALEKAGLEYTPPEATEGLVTPMQRFLGFLTHSENQLRNLATEVNTMHLKDDEISPASMLMVQIKVAYVQQEIELFTNLLNKTLESTKTIMNVQV